ncbi:GntR family transcriptional regulator [Lichenihabitans psoromatis]|uniref:GntR family transcriptional regulator n=2 Tax=Lichenihabitans psoromatis TaxID=2528642 RepID=UPI001035EBD3|nr:GntR family transcriptional regulator [Lichenihabitans psoromatis]
MLASDKDAHLCDAAAAILHRMGPRLMDASAHHRSTAAVQAPEPATAKRSSKAGHVYHEIKEAILSGLLEPGSPIDKAELCERLGMSRFPVTTAINRLAYDRLVVIEPQHGSFVAKIALSDVRECMLIRTAIEAEIAAVAAERAPRALIDDLNRNLRYEAAAADADDRPGLYALDVAFHRSICDSLGLAQAGIILDTLRSHLERIRRILMTPPGRMASTVEEHRAIVDGMSTGDPDAARLAMRRHLAQTTALFDSFAQQNPTLFSDLP